VRANDQLEKMESIGIPYDDVVDTLEREGVEKFTASWIELLDQVESA
jgi:transaldolase